MTELEIIKLSQHYLALRQEHEDRAGEPNRYKTHDNYVALGCQIAPFLDTPLHIEGKVLTKAYYWKGGVKTPTIQMFTEESYKKYLSFKEKSGGNK